MASTQAVVFWVYERSEITIHLPVARDAYQLVFVNNALETKRNEGEGSYEAGSVTRTFEPGIYGVSSELPFRYEIGKGKVEVHVKGGKDPWPLPPPPPPQGFEKVTSQMWRDEYAKVFMNIGGFVTAKLAQLLQRAIPQPRQRRA